MARVIVEELITFYCVRQTAIAAGIAATRLVVLLSAKMGIEAHRERARSAALDELARRFGNARQRDATAPKT